MSAHLCDTCKFRHEECKPENFEFEGDAVVVCDGYEKEDGTCSA